MTAPYQSDETTELILAFPGNYPDSATEAKACREQEEAWARWEQEDQEAEVRLEAWIARNYGDCGVPTDIGLIEGWPELTGPQAPIPY